MAGLVSSKEVARVRRVLLVSALILWGFGATAQQINPPLGPYLHPRPEDLALAKNFTAQDRVVLTSYFYWYDVNTGAHLYNPDGSDALS